MVKQEEFTLRGIKLNKQGGLTVSYELNEERDGIHSVTRKREERQDPLTDKVRNVLGGILSQSLDGVRIDDISPEMKVTGVTLTGASDPAIVAKLEILTSWGLYLMTAPKDYLSNNGIKMVWDALEGAVFDYLFNEQELEAFGE